MLRSAVTSAAPSGICSRAGGCRRLFGPRCSICRRRLADIIDHAVDQVLFVDLGPSEGRGDRVITAIGKPYSPFDSPCIVIDGLKET